MRSTKSKTQNNQIPSMQGRAGQNQDQFNLVLVELFNGDTSTGYNSLLTDLFDMWAGKAPKQPISMPDIASAVYSVYSINRFIRKIKECAFGLSEVSESICQLTDEIDLDETEAAINSALQEWIYPEDFCVIRRSEYTRVENLFNKVSLLITECEVIHDAHNEVVLEGGLLW